MGFRFFNVLDNKAMLTADAGNIEPYQLPGISGEVLEVEGYYLLQKTGSLRQPYRRVAPAAYALSMGIFKRSDSSQLAYQNNLGFANNAADGSKMGVMSLTTAEILAVWAEATEIEVYFTINVDTANGGYEVFRQETTLYKPKITTGLVVAAASDIQATQAWVLGLFQRLNSPAGVRRIERDELGNAYEVFIENGQQRVVALENAPAAVP